MKKLFLLILATLFVVSVVSCSKSDPWSHGNKQEGTLEVSTKNLQVPKENPNGKLIATYKNPDGLYMPTAITIEPDADGYIDGDNMVFYLTVGTYTVKAGKLSIQVKVSLK